MVSYVNSAHQNRIEDRFSEQTINGISIYDTNDQFSVCRRLIVGGYVPPLAHLLGPFPSLSVEVRI